MIDLIYLCGGKGKRVNLGYPKQYAQIGGKYLFMHALENFYSIKEISKIIIVADNVDKVISIIEKYDFDINRFEIIPGGNTRQESVNNGLEFVKSDFVLIGEGVRPFVGKEFIIYIISKNGYIVVPYSIIKSTPFNIENSNTYDRNKVFEVQTPQKYNVEVLREAHRLGKKYDIKSTDDLDLIYKTSILEKFDIHNVSRSFFEGPPLNIKITTPEDLFIANCLFSAAFGGLSNE